MDALSGSLHWVALVLQLLGLVSVWMARLSQSTRLARPGRYLFVACLCGLGITSALCSVERSGLATLTGGTVGLLLVAMVVESGSGQPADPTAP